MSHQTLPWDYSEYLTGKMSQECISRLCRYSRTYKTMFSQWDNCQGNFIYNDWYLTIAIVLIHLFGNLLVIYYILGTTSSVYNVAGLQFCQVVSITSILEMRALRVLMTNIRQPRGKANTVYLSKCTWWCSLNTSPSQNYHRFQPKAVSSYHLSKNKKRCNFQEAE